MKRVFTIITAVLISAVSLAQTDAFKAWLKNGKGELAKQKFANKKLDKKEAEEAAIVIDSLWLQEQARALKGEWKKMILTHDTLQFREFIYNVAHQVCFCQVCCTHCAFFYIFA